jgi:UDP-N-acetyl-D-glucosamine dehydrogenase
MDARYDRADLFAQIENAKAVIGVIGMGYVGLPLMLAATAKKFRAIGFDVDAHKVEKRNCGKGPLKHVTSARIAAMREAQLFEATNDMQRLSEVDVVVICVPTPLGKHREPDLSFVVNTTKEIAAGEQRPAVEPDCRGAGDCSLQAARMAEQG